MDFLKEMNNSFWVRNPIAVNMENTLDEAISLVREEDTKLQKAVKLLFSNDPGAQFECTSFVGCERR